MQAELNAAAGPGRLPIHLLGVNARGLEAGNAGMAALGTCSWLQDTDQQMVWSRWQVEYRDVVVIGARNQRLETYNLTLHDLGSPANYAYLKRLLIEAATIAP